MWPCYIGLAQKGVDQMVEIRDIWKHKEVFNTTKMSITGTEDSGSNQMQ